jgi:hypothetical protein
LLAFWGCENTPIAWKQAPTPEPKTAVETTDFTDGHGSPPILSERETIILVAWLKRSARIGEVFESV